MQPRTNSFLLPQSRSIATGSFASSAIFQVLLAVAVVSLAAQVRIPIPNSTVPMTLQSLAVLVLGLTLSPARAIAAMVLYIAAGTVGLPLFTPNSLGLFGPTAGYLLGFVPAVGLASVIRGRGAADFGRLVFAGLVGITALFVLGVAWLSVVMKLPLIQAVVMGVLPFVGKALIEVVFAATLCRTVFRRRGTIKD